MGKPIIRLGVDASMGHPPYPPTMPDRASSNVFCNKTAVVRKGDTYTLHCYSDCHVPIAQGSGKQVYVNGLEVQCQTDPLSCGDTSMGGSTNVKAG